MDSHDLARLLERVRQGELPPAEAVDLIRMAPFEDTGGYARVDLQRGIRCGFPEVVFGQGKTPEQVEGILKTLLRHGQGGLVTRVEAATAAHLARAFPQGEHNASGRTFRIRPPGDPGPKLGKVVVVTAGTSDLPVAEEARVTAEAWNCEVTLVVDVGVAGLHRLLYLHGEGGLNGADALVVVAGMEGALPSVVGGLVDCPVIAVPTSIGYGANFGGLAALLGMLNSCASNVVVVNIDAGFNGGHVAGLIARRAGQARAIPIPYPGKRLAMPLERVETIPNLARRPAESHKGMYGTVLVVAGGRGMAGAAAMTGISALRSGAGLVRIACPAEVQPTVASFEPSYMTFPLENDADGLIRFEPARRALTPLLSSASVLAMGPGLGQSDDLKKLVRWVLESVEIPTVLDADALNALGGETDLLASLKRPVVLTPHPGEFARLTGRAVAEIQADREGSAASLAEAGNLVVVLKGNATVVTDGARVYVNTTGNPGMAKGGPGDVLTGVIAALISQHLPPFEAAQLGVYAHGLAGDMARDQNGEVGMIAGDIVDVLADAFFHLAG